MNLTPQHTLNLEVSAKPPDQDPNNFIGSLSFSVAGSSLPNHGEIIPAD